MRSEKHILNSYGHYFCPIDSYTNFLKLKKNSITYSPKKRKEVFSEISLISSVENLTAVHMYLMPNNLVRCRDVIKFEKEIDRWAQRTYIHTTRVAQDS